MRYIELNFVRASMVEHPGEYKWSSYSANAQNENDGLIERYPTYLELGAVDENRQAAYREFFRNHIDGDTLHEIRESLNHELVLGRSYFKGRIEEITNRQMRLGIPGRPMIGKEGVSMLCISILETIAL
jgi:putative transposase